MAGKPRPQARAAWQAILKVVPTSQEAAARLGRLAWEDGDHSLAAALLERAVAHEAPAPVWFDLGLVRQDLRDRDGAARAYRKALDLKPDYAEAALNLGTVLQEAGDLDGAMARLCRQPIGCARSMFGTIAMALTSAPHGRLWLDEAALRALRSRSASCPSASRAKMLAIDVGRGQHVGDGLRIGRRCASSKLSNTSSGAVRGTAKHCATGVPFGSTPEKSGSVHSAGKLMPPS